MSIVTTCKGRLDSLRQSLPRMAAQPRVEVVVVDYDCPDGTGDWVAAEYPAVRVVRVENAPLFNLSRARNAGARAAHTQWLCFVDADILIDASFVERALPMLHAGAFYSMADPPNAHGTAFCLRSDHLAVEGYDEVLEGWGGEDTDFYIRLARLGLVHQRFPRDWVRAITHGAEVRVRFYATKDRWLNQRINSLYAQIKHDLSRHLGVVNVPLGMRQAAYAEVRRVLERGSAAGELGARIEITLPSTLDVRLFGWEMKRSWTYVLEPAAQPAAPTIPPHGTPPAWFATRSPDSMPERD